MTMNTNMKIKMEEENDSLPISQNFQVIQQLYRQSLHASSSMSMSMSMLEIHDYPEKAVRCKRKRPSEKHCIKGIKRKTEEACAKSPVVQRAEDVQANLSAEFPSFYKIMIHSVVCHGFWLSLPREFCQLNLPDHDATVILVDESGKQYRINYLAQRRALSGGWKKFSTDHDLLLGDAAVFHMIRPSKFKVYIVRMNGLAEVDAALGLLRLQRSAKPICSYNAGKNNSGPVSPDIVQYEVHINGLSYHGAEENQSENGNLDIGNGSSEVEGIRSSPEVKVEFKQLKGGIRASEISTTQADLVTWENTSSDFEGTDIDFLHKRAQHLLSLTFESKQEVNSRRYKEAKSIELELLGRKEEMQRLDILK